jgi:beta-glucosidase-like glycosyl hydrolase
MRAAEQVFVGIPGPELDSESAGLLSAFQPGGVVLFKRNIQDEEQLNDLVTTLRRLLPDAVFALDTDHNHRHSLSRPERLASCG